MGRPRKHDNDTAMALLEAAEWTIQRHGLDALSVRGVADDVGTTTRAVYSLFASKEGLIVALAARAFELLGAAVHALPATGDPAADLVSAAVDVFRPFAIAHPVLFRVGIQRTGVAPDMAGPFEAARMAALVELEARLRPLETAGRLGGRPIRRAALIFHALCEGLGEMELRGGLPNQRAEEIWRDAVGALVAGLAAPPAERAS